MMTWKRILTLLLTISLTMTLVPCFELTAHAAHTAADLSMFSQPEGDSAILNSPSGAGERVTFIVEVEGDPLAVQSGISPMSDTEKTEELLAEQQMVMSRIHGEVDANAEKGFVYTAVFNGFSVEGTLDQLEEIKALDGVKNVYISSEMEIIEPVSEPMLDSAGGLTHTNTAYDKGYAGEGTVIAIIDIGCDTSHEFFATAPENPRYSKEDIDKIVKNTALNADASSANQVYKNAKIPYAYNYITKTADTYMHSHLHGTHVAGIAAGKNGTLTENTKFSGVAPEAQLLVLSCGREDGMLTTAAILAAMNDAMLLGADVINMSFGIDYKDASCDTAYPTVFENVRKAGVTLVASNGNAARGYEMSTPHADKPDYATAGTPCGHATTTAVASANNSYRWHNFSTLALPESDTVRVYSAHEDNPIKDAFPEEGYLEYVYCGLGYPEDFTGKDVKGKLALVKRGEITFVEKAANAKAAGAVGIIIYNTSEEVFSCPVPLGIPAATATLSIGEELFGKDDKRLGYQGEGNAKEENANPAKISSFSSWGTDSSLQLKPEITAPGGNIYSSIPDNKYTTASGTSMAAPHMTGISALSLQYYRTEPFLEEFNHKEGEERVLLLENLAMNSADIIRQDNGVPYSPRVQGAGLVNMEGILKSRVLLTGDAGKAKLSLGDDLTDTIEIAFDITNISEEALTFDKISADVFTDGYIESEEGYLVDEPVSIPTLSDTLPEAVTVAPGETKKFSATITLDADFIAANSEIFTNGFYVDGYVVLDTKDATERASLPFTGFYGDWGAAPIFDSTIYDEGGSYLVEADGSGGTYLVISSNAGRKILGKNYFFPEMFGEKYIAYSTNSGYALGTIMNNLRAMNNIVQSITDEQGNPVVQKKIDDNIPKFTSYIFSFGSSKLRSLEEGNYYYTFSASLLGDTEKTDELRIPFTVDNTPPEVLSVVYDEEEETVTVTAKENHYFAAFYLAYPEGSEKQYEYKSVADTDYTADRSVTKVFNVSMIEDISEAEIGCVDYAYNETFYDMNYFLDTVGAVLAGMERLDGATQAEFTLQNNTAEALNGDFILAFYDDADRLVEMNTQKYTIDANAEEKLVYTFWKNTKAAAYVKLFVWDFQQMKPVDTPKRFILSD